MDPTPQSLIRGRSTGDRRSSNYAQPPMNSIKRSLSRKNSTLGSTNTLDSSKSSNIFFDTPQVINYPGQHCVQFLTLLPHQEKLFYMNLFQRKNQFSSNPISHIEHRTKSHVFMEISAFDSPVCRIRISAKEKRNIERVLELFDEYCPVLLKYSNHQELCRVRQSLLPDGSPSFSSEVRPSSSTKLPTLRRVPSTRRRESSAQEKVKTAKPRLVKVMSRNEKKNDTEKMTEKGENQEKIVREKTKERKQEKKSVPKETRDKDKLETKENVEKETVLDEDKHSESSVSHEEKEAEFEREPTFSSLDGDAANNNELSVISVIESMMKSDRDVLAKPSMTLKSKMGDHRKLATPVEICQELESVAEGYLQREKERVEKMKMKAAEPKTHQNALEKFRALVWSGKPQKKTKKEKQNANDKILEKEKEWSDNADLDAQDAKMPDVGDAEVTQKRVKGKRKRRKILQGAKRPASGIRRDLRK